MKQKIFGQGHQVGAPAGGFGNQGGGIGKVAVHVRGRNHLDGRHAHGGGVGNCHRREFLAV